jgi:diacylglycerol kinase family enzyme
MEEILKLAPNIPKIGQLTSGTGNDFFFTFHKKSQMIKTIKLLRNPKFLKIDVGEIKYKEPEGEIRKRLFFSSFGALSMSQALIESNKYKKLGGLKYTIGGIITSIKGALHPMKLFVDGEEVFNG